MLYELGPGNRQLMPGLAERALRIIRECYADFGPTLACEKLAEIHGLYLAKETVRKQVRGLWPQPAQLLVYVDDATSWLMQLLFASSESTFTYFEARRGWPDSFRPCHGGTLARDRGIVYAFVFQPCPYRAYATVNMQYNGGEHCRFKKSSIACWQIVSPIILHITT